MLLVTLEGFGTRAVAPAGRHPGFNTFVSLARVRGGTVIERFALGAGRALGILARVPALRSTSDEVDVSEPHLTIGGSYVITLGHDVNCKPVPSSECIPVGANTCGSRVESLNPASHRWTTVFTEPPDRRVFDAVPSPDGHSFALLEGGCSTADFTIAIRAGATGREVTLGKYNPACRDAPTAAWSSDGAQLVFVDSVGPPRADGVLDCVLAVASSRHPSSKSSRRFVTPDAGCSFSSGTFDPQGIAAIEICGPEPTGGTTRLLQLDHHRHVMTRINLPGAEPGRDNDGVATVAAYPRATTVLVSQDFPDPTVTRTWTFDGAHLHFIRRFHRPLLAEP